MGVKCFCCFKTCKYFLRLFYASGRSYPGGGRNLGPGGPCREPRLALPPVTDVGMFRGLVCLPSLLPTKAQRHCSVFHLFSLKKISVKSEHHRVRPGSQQGEEERRPAPQRGDRRALELGCRGELCTRRKLLLANGNITGTETATTHGHAAGQRSWR